MDTSTHWLATAEEEEAKNDNIDNINRIGVNDNIGNISSIANIDNSDNIDNLPLQDRLGESVDQQNIETETKLYTIKGDTDWLVTEEPLAEVNLPLQENEEIPSSESTETPTKKSKKRTVTGKRINRPLEYNYPQKCQYCGQVFLEKEMVRHMKVHPESFTLDCVPCGKFFLSKAAYDQHYNIHKIYHCIPCKKDFNARKHYRSHMERIHESDGERPRIHQCDICNKNFKDKFVLNTHKKTHYNIKAHQCPMCEYASNNLTYMRLHVMNHTNQLPFKCHVCYRNFLTDELLQSHINKLHGEEPRVYSCDTCGKISTSKGNLRQHKKIHDPNLQRKEHQCFECGKTFALKCRLRKHALIHKGQDKCHCTICGKLLSKDSYRKHLKSHSGEKPFLCDCCGESFSTNSALSVHRKSHTGEKLHKTTGCGQCGSGGPQGELYPQQKRFMSEDCLANCDNSTCTKKETGLPCDFCGKIFPHQSALLGHKNAYHVAERPYIFISYAQQ